MEYFCIIYGCTGNNRSRWENSCGMQIWTKLPALLSFRFRSNLSSAVLLSHLGTAGTAFFFKKNDLIFEYLIVIFFKCRGNSREIRLFLCCEAPKFSSNLTRFLLIFYKLSGNVISAFHIRNIFVSILASNSDYHGYFYDFPQAIAGRVSENSPDSLYSTSSQIHSHKLLRLYCSIILTVWIALSSTLSPVHYSLNTMYQWWHNIRQKVEIFMYLIKHHAMKIYVNGGLAPH
jgi:hypothetical protein